MELINTDCLKYLKSLPDCSVDLIFTDPPYALGSEIIIRSDGKPDYKKAVDFMNKWQMPGGDWWEQWFREAFRVLKYGGRCLMFSIDRQTFLFKYYANLAQFTESQSIYWYFISSFPKSTDLSKKIDDISGHSLKWFIDYVIEYANRKGISKKELSSLFPSKNGNMTGWLYNKASGNQSLTIEQYNKIRDFLNLPFDKIDDVKREIIGIGNAGVTCGKIGNFSGEKEFNITAPSTDLAKKYDGFKYSCAPLKQTVETIMVFQKPYKTGSCLHDTLAMEEGDNEITCGAVDIDGNRVPTEENLKTIGGENSGLWKGKKQQVFIGNTEGRYPSQSFVDSGAAEVLDKQSGINMGSGNVKIGGTPRKTEGFICTGSPNRTDSVMNIGYSGGCSKILHKCDYDEDEFDLYMYCPKVSPAERNEGCEKLSMKIGGGMTGTENKSLLTGSGNERNNLYTNNHPTVKPISLAEKVIGLFKTPNKQTMIDPFMGSGSLIIGANNKGFDTIGIELNPEYYDIAHARIEHWEKKKRMNQAQKTIKFD